MKNKNQEKFDKLDDKLNKLPEQAQMFLFWQLCKKYKNKLNIKMANLKVNDTPSARLYIAYERTVRELEVLEEILTYEIF